MADWIETYQGVVSAWECDIVEHFTIAYYFEKFADATRNFIELIGEGESLGPCVGTGPSRLVATFESELRAGAAFNMTSAVTGLEGDTLQIGHQLIDTAKGKTVTWLAESLALPPSLGAEARTRIAARAVAWSGPALKAPDPLPAAKGDLTARDRVKPWELDERGRLSLSDHVHRFSGAGMHFLNSIGMSGAYMHANRRGFSTFLLDVALVSPAHVGERIDVHTAVAHLGNTSMRYVHRMIGADGRAIASMVQAGVQLDLDARRPTAFPDDIRRNISAALGAS
ncbi:MAG: thioesterase family protein [Hyphomicrobiaceae bacterium]